LSLTSPGPAGHDGGRASLELADWRRRIAELYASVRERAIADPEAAWIEWRTVREAMYREHPQSPVPAPARASFRASCWPYDPAWRFEVDVRTDAAPDPGGGASGPPGAAPAGSVSADPAAPAVSFEIPSGFALQLPMSSGDALSFDRLGAVTLPLAAGPRTLALFWMAGYTGGLFLPFRDATNGSSTYGAGRYLLDTAKSADLGGDLAAGRLILDFNFAFHPSCAFDPRWSCPLAPPENRLDVAVEAGERLRG
jgi:uncharacterized protein (DUF1684 family)